jgi:hypothetical protein
MDARVEKAFENDSSLDWLGQLEGVGVNALREALESVADIDPASVRQWGSRALRAGSVDHVLDG